MSLPTAMLKRRLHLKKRYFDYKLIAMPTSLALTHSLVVSMGTNRQWMEQRGNEIEEFFKGEGVTQATTLYKCTQTEVVELNPLLFEDSDEYSMHYGAIPFEVCEIERK
jgi:hypothetical protein